jgi:hypothetical protein
MHEWTSQVPQSFSTAWEFWQRQAPLIAFEHRYVLDSILCLAALHASRREPQQWLSLEGRMAPTTGKLSEIKNVQTIRNQLISPPWTLPSEIRVPETADVRSRLQKDQLALDQHRGEMLRVARIYFERALAGQNKALPAIDAESGEACYLASICVSYAALFSLGENQNEANTWLSDPIQWVRIAHGSRVVVSLLTSSNFFLWITYRDVTTMISLFNAQQANPFLTISQIRHWASFAGWDWLKSSGIFYGKPDMNDKASLYARSNAAPFEKLRTWARDHETQSDDDADAYLKAVSYIGVMYKGIREGFDSTNATARRIMAMSSVMPDRWTEMLEERRPRALAMLMHVFACGELIAKENFWFRGIAKTQIPRLCEGLPVAWQPMVAWPLRVTEGDVGSEPVETKVGADEL